jgi:protein TonB
MFDKLVESSNVKRKNPRVAYFCATAAVWMVAVTTVVAAGVFAYDARLSDQFELMTLVLPVPPPAPPQGARAHPEPRASMPPEGMVASPDVPGRIALPSGTPPSIPDITGDDLSVVGGVPGDPRGGLPTGVLGGLPASTVPTELPPPAPRPKKEEVTATQQPIQKPRISIILQGSAIRRVEPPYPPIARAIRAQGPVVVEVVVDEHGNVISARAISGHHQLRPAAEAAARQWKWNPTMLNGLAVQVVGTITFNFVL